jgi:hypothetical protein
MSFEIKCAFEVSQEISIDKSGVGLPADSNDVGFTSALVRFVPVAEPRDRTEMLARSGQL